jgi:hypothetical protein
MRARLALDEFSTSPRIEAQFWYIAGALTCVEPSWEGAWHEAFTASRCSCLVSYSSIKELTVEHRIGEELHPGRAWLARHIGESLLEYSVHKRSGTGI